MRMIHHTGWSAEYQGGSCRRASGDNDREVQKEMVAIHFMLIFESTIIDVDLNLVGAPLLPEQ